MKAFIITISTLSIFVVSACASEKPLSLEEQAAQMNITVDEFREAQQKAAQMGMSMDQHTQMNGN